MVRQLNKCFMKTPGIINTSRLQIRQGLESILYQVVSFEYSEFCISRFIVMSTELFGPTFVKAIFIIQEVELAKALT